MPIAARQNEEKTSRNLTYRKIESKGNNKNTNAYPSQPLYLQKTVFF